MYPKKGLLMLPGTYLFGQYRISNSWDIPDVDKWCQDKCCLLKPVLVEVDAELGNKCVFKWLLGKTIFFFFFLTGNTPSLLCGLEFANIRVDG